MPESGSTPFALEVEEHILANAGPFQVMTQETSVFVSDYLTAKITHNGVEATREAHFTGDAKLKESFFQRLTWTGYRALEAGARRHAASAARGEAVRDLISLELADLMEAEGLVSRISGTGFCTPLAVTST